jgi:hypothetical protein
LPWNAFTGIWIKTGGCCHLQSFNLSHSPPHLTHNFWSVPFVLIPTCFVVTSLSLWPSTTRTN